jgi:Fe-S cluster biogenesis protein NfuA
MPAVASRRRSASGMSSTVRQKSARLRALAGWQIKFLYLFWNLNSIWLEKQSLTRRTKMKEKVEAALNKIRPMLQRDGGNVELVEVENGVVKVRLQGACAGCPMSQMTIKNGIEKLLKQEIPEVQAVESV